MIQTQQFEAFPVFGDSSSKAQPEAAIYSNGFAPQDVLPAEYFNWFINKASNGITDLNKGVSSIETELNNVVVAGGAEPTEETSNQVITAIKYLIAQAKKEAILDAHPVGSLYWSSKDTNPSQLFGGTWTQIKDKFILAAGYYTNGATGGESFVTLTTTQIPSHRHTGPSHTHYFTAKGSVGAHSHVMEHKHKMMWEDVDGSSWVDGLVARYSGSYNQASSNFSFVNTDKNRVYPTNDYHMILTTQLYVGNTSNSTPSFSGTRTTTESAGTGYTSYTGNGGSHNNMPPYIVKYCWERTA